MADTPRATTPTTPTGKGGKNEPSGPLTTAAQVARLSTVTTADDQEAAIREEYGQYVAAVPIDIDGARAFNVNDPVPVGHVTSGLVPEQFVAKAGSPAAEVVAAASPTSPTTADASKEA